VLLEVLHEGFSALVGPMGGPAVPPSLAEEQACSLDELIARVGFGADSERHGIYPVTVLYVGFLGHAADPPARGPKESDRDYRIRCASAEHVRVERSRHEGFYAICYDVPVADWRACDLEAMLGLVHALLPAPEPHWRESGTILVQSGLVQSGLVQSGLVQSGLIQSGVTQSGTTQSGTQEMGTQVMGGVPVAKDTPPTRPRYALEVARGDFVAYLRLPAFPVQALVEWLSSRGCEINLCHPIRRMPAAKQVHSNVHELSNAR